MKPSEKWIDIEREKNVEKNVAGDIEWERGREKEREKAREYNPLCIIANMVNVSNGGKSWTKATSHTHKKLTHTMRAIRWMRQIQQPNGRDGKNWKRKMNWVRNFILLHFIMAFLCSISHTNDGKTRRCRRTVCVCLCEYVLCATRCAICPLDVLYVDT